MTAINQDFTTYQGDSCLPQFTVINASGAPVDISNAVDIEWDLGRDPGSTPVLRKLMSGHEIDFVTDGKDGKFQVIITPSDTTPLSGYYIHRAVVTMGGSGGPAVTTVALGRCQVGRQPIWTYSGDPQNSPRDAVRMWIDDTAENQPLLMDPEIDAVLVMFPNPVRAAAQCARIVAARFAKRVSKRVGDLSISFSDLSKQYFELAAELQMTADTSLRPYSGGISRTDKATYDQNFDRERPPFRWKQFDNRSGFNNTSEWPFGCWFGDGS